MTKQKMIDFINDYYDWFERMQMGLGHHSWWYTNRSPKDCINVKLHNWFNIEDLEEKLTDQEKKLIDQLNFNIYEVIDWYSWNLIISDARDNLEYDLKEKFNVSRLEYGGRQGGWLAVVYKWEWVPSDYDVDEYSYQEVQEFYKIIKKAIEEDELVTDYILDRKKSLDNFLSNADNFIDEVRTCLYNTLEAKQEAAHSILKIKVKKEEV